MVEHHEETAEKVVAAFKSSLKEEICQQINRTQFDELERAIRQALSDERAMAVELIEELVKKMRSKVDRPELEL